MIKTLFDSLRRRWRSAELQPLIDTAPAALHGPAQDIPPGIKATWLACAAEELPGWQPGEHDWQLASRALVQFFSVCAAEHGAACALPSKAADSIWHVWLQEGAPGLARWQQQHFGRTIPHREAAELDAPMPQALARSWVAASRSEGHRLDRMPLMFAADGRLGAPGGWAYQQRSGRVWHRDIDERGRASGAPQPHAGLAVGGLAAFGLLTAPEIAMYQRQREQAGAGGSSCGSAGSSSSGDCGDGGSGCSCGGGGCGS